MPETRSLPRTRARERTECRSSDVVAELVTAHLELLAADPALVRVIQWETLHADGHLMEALSSHAESLADLIREVGSRSKRTLGEAESTDLLVDAAALCWFPFAYADALERLLGRDPCQPTHSRLMRRRSSSS